MPPKSKKKRDYTAGDIDDEEQSKELEQKLKRTKINSQMEEEDGKEEEKATVYRNKGNLKNSVKPEELPSTFSENMNKEPSEDRMKIEEEQYSGEEKGIEETIIVDENLSEGEKTKQFKGNETIEDEEEKEEEKEEEELGEQEDDDDEGEEEQAEEGEEKEVSQCSEEESTTDIDGRHLYKIPSNDMNDVEAKFRAEWDIEKDLGDLIKQLLNDGEFEKWLSYLQKEVAKSVNLFFPGPDDDDNYKPNEVRRIYSQVLLEGVSRLDFLLNKFPKTERIFVDSASELIYFQEFVQKYAKKPQLNTLVIGLVENKKGLPLCLVKIRDMKSMNDELKFLEEEFEIIKEKSQPRLTQFYGLLVGSKTIFFFLYKRDENEENYKLKMSKEFSAKIVESFAQDKQYQELKNVFQIFIGMLWRSLATIENETVSE